MRLSWLRPCTGALAILASAPVALGAQARTMNGPTFTVTDSSVRQGRFEAVALSRDTIVSSYPRAAREVRFRFSINGVENEFPSGTEHTIYLRPVKGRMVTPLYVFGVETAPPPPTPEESASSEDGTGQVTFRLDLRRVLQSLRTTGRYHPPLGAPITRGGLRTVYVLGDPAPLTWDYAALHPGSPLELKDPDGDGIYEGTVPIQTEYARPRTSDGRARWARVYEITGFPELTSSQRMQDAVYRLSIEELQQLVRRDGALSAGAKWPGVWTRDVSLSAILSLALVAPDATRRSLLAKVDSSGRIIQDTGTGGSWPVSSDRMVWALAAWEVYLATGDQDWLRQSYDIIRRSAAADLHAVRDPATGLFNGESSFMDWREQSYPRWMQPADIYRSQNLGTNAVHYAAYRALGEMARTLGDPSARWDSTAAGIERGMTQYLWQPSQGWYGQYRYGRTALALSPRSDALGEALASIYGAASLAQRQALSRSTPWVGAGTPTFWPYIQGERFYHNATVWPFVTAYSAWAAAEGGNTRAVQQGLDDATRAVALFLTNKENMVASTGHYEGTALNSDRQLWSVAGTLAATYRILFGIRLEAERMAFKPMVPPTYRGDRTLRNVHYRGVTLTITIHGYGDSVATTSLDGHVMHRAEIPATYSGEHTIELTMNGRWPAAETNMVANRFAPATPKASWAGDMLSWQPVAAAVRYTVYRNGKPIGQTTHARSAAPARDGLDEYQVLALNRLDDQSFLSEPVRVAPNGAAQLVKPAPAGLEHVESGYSGGGYLRLTRENNIAVAVPVQVTADGVYAIDLRYANGNGPVNTEDKVAVRTLLVDGDTAGVVVMPQRGVNRWSEWGWSNVLRVRLARGAHALTLVYTPLDANMNGRENTALLDAVRLTRLSRDAAADLLPRR